MFRYLSTYQVQNGDDLGSATYWNTRFYDIDVRLNSCEIYASTITDAVDNITTLGLARINDAIQPYVTTLEGQITGLQIQINGFANTIISDQADVISQLNTLLAQGQTYVTNLQTLGTVSDGTF